MVEYKLLKEIENLLNEEKNLLKIKLFGDALKQSKELLNLLYKMKKLMTSDDEIWKEEFFKKKYRGTR